MHPRRSRRSRSPRADAQGPRHFRSRMYEDLSNTADETHNAQGNSNHQSSGWHSPHLAGNHMVARRSDGSVSGNGTYHDLSNPGWPSSAGNPSETLSSNNLYSLVNHSDPWDHQPVAYQNNADDVNLYSAPSFLTSPTNGASMSFLSLAHSQTPTFPSSVFQSAQAQTVQTHSDWASEDDVPLTRTYRRFSTRARQGSSVHVSDSDPYGNNATNQNESIEENDSNESSGEISPVDQSQYFHTDGRDDPWSPEFPRHASGHRH
ncbi:hypothetical protein NPX13_g170 [Xylaria arbuscula]|uniref:Uncharacterized protein n=1 Tax=Xylaria arbuscula TaxID=114810 RepID=A0A9W8TSK0_9PEZI|nr:hypothetical protein NPX13_g170 [Xylaria arbuscula]